MYYTVSWREEGGGDSYNITGAANTMYQITGLAQGTQYTVNVTAHNSVGESEAATGSGTTLSVGGEWLVCGACASIRWTRTLQHDNSLHLLSPPSSPPLSVGCS